MSKTSVQVNSKKGLMLTRSGKAEKNVMAKMQKSQARTGVDTSVYHNSEYPHEIVSLKFTEFNNKS